jgi:hypothetical protein
MEDIPSPKPSVNDNPVKRFLTGGYSRWVLAAIVILAVIILLNQTIFPRLGFKFRFDSGGIKLQKYTFYSQNESMVLGILIYDTPVLGEIPRKEYIRSRTGLNPGEYDRIIRSLAGKGDLLLGESGEIIDAYPWTDSGELYFVYLTVNEDSTIGPLRAASPFYALSVSPLLGIDTHIESRFKDNRKPLGIRIEDNRIVYTTNMTTVVYLSDDYKNCDFYSSPDAVESDYAGQYDNSKVFRLDRALVVGDIIARDIKEKIDR